MGIFPGGVRDLSHVLGNLAHVLGNLAHVLGNLAHGSNPGKTTPLAGLETTGAYRRALRNQDSAHEGHAQTCLLPVTAQSQQMENFLGPWPAYQDHPSVSRSLLRAPAPAPLALALHLLRRGLLLRVRTPGGLRACLHPAPDSDQCGGRHCQPGCQSVHPGGSKAASQAENVVTW